MRIVILGAGGHGKVVLDILQAAGGHEVVGFLDADDRHHGQVVLGTPVLGATNLLPKLKREGVAGAIVAVGDNAVRQQLAREVVEAGLELVSAVHPTASVAASASIGPGVVVCRLAAVCVEVRLETACIVNTAAVVDHECVVGAGAHICPGVRLAGRVTVGERAFVGIGASVIQCRQIGEDAVVGAGAVVIDDVEPGEKVVGVPARCK
ncbi:MAG: acetyltransferase [Phycisphaerae bacterium]